MSISMMRAMGEVMERKVFSMIDERAETGGSIGAVVSFINEQTDNRLIVRMRERIIAHLKELGYEVNIGKSGRYYVYRNTYAVSKKGSAQ